MKKKIITLFSTILFILLLNACNSEYTGIDKSDSSETNTFIKNEMSTTSSETSDFISSESKLENSTVEESLLENTSGESFYEDNSSEENSLEDNTNDNSASESSDTESDDSDTPTELVSDYKYKLVNNDKTVIITSYTGSDKSIHIPSKINNKTVVAIDSYAFRNTVVTNVVIPDSILQLNEYAFAEATKLKK